MDDATLKDLLERTKCVQRDVAKLSTNVAEMRGQIAAERTQQAVDMASFRASNERIRQALWGSGDANQPGLVTRLDRMEQAEMSRSRWLRWLGAILAAIVGDRLIRFFRGLP